MNEQLFSLMLLTVGLVFIVTAVYVLIKRKPLIYSARWMQLIVFLSIMPIMFLSLNTGREPLTLFRLIPLLVLGLIIVITFFTTKGYTIFGGNGADIQRALIEVLKDKNLEFEQLQDSVKIKEPALEILVSRGLKPKGRSNQKFFLEIIKAMRTKNIKSNLVFPVFYILFGLIISVFCFYMMFHKF